MKKIILSLLVILFISAIAFAAPAEKDPGGFRSYPWGTSFEKIHNEIDLQEIKNKNGLSLYVDLKASIINTDSGMAIGYYFSDNQLVGAALVTFNQTEYFQVALKELKDHFGSPDGFDSKEDHYFYQLPTTYIYYVFKDKKDPSLSGIFFGDRIFYEKNKDKF